MKKMTRREERDSIVRIIFRKAFYPSNKKDKTDEMKAQTEDYLQLLTDEPGVILPSLREEPAEEDKEYIREKVDKILAVLPELDQSVESASVDWKISRIGKMELSILRVAAYEIKFDEDIPNKVAVNEAIELAKIYCDESAPAFINGVLNKLLVSESSQGVETTPEG